MKTYTLMVQGGLCKDLQADSLDHALELAKKMLNYDSWYMCPIYMGEMRVDTAFKLEGKKYRMHIALNKDKE